MEQVLLVVQVIVAAALIGMVLLQRSDTDGFGLGSGGGSNLLSGRAAANLLTRTTAILAALFIINSLVLSILAAHQHQVSLVDSIAQEEVATPAKDAKAMPVKAEAKSAVKAEKSSAPAVPNAGEDVKAPAKPAAKKAPAATTDKADKSGAAE